MKWLRELTCQHCATLISRCRSVMSCHSQQTSQFGPGFRLSLLQLDIIPLRAIYSAFLTHIGTHTPRDVFKSTLKYDISGVVIFS